MNPHIIPQSVSCMSKEQVKADLKQTVKRIIMEGITGRVNSDKIPRSTVGWNQASIASYLKNQGYDYSLSVFLAESDVSPDKLQLINKDRNNPESNKILFQVWEKLEEKYSALLKQRINEMESELSGQIYRVENILRRKIQEEENTLKIFYGRKLDELETKEREMEDMFEKRQQNAESQMENERKELLRQIREVEIRRRELGKVESQLATQIEKEMKNLRQMREDLTNFESDLRRRELEVNLILERRSQKIRIDEQTKYKEKLNEFMNREEKLRNLIEHAVTNNSQYETLQFLLKERDKKILHLEESLEVQKRENAQLVQQLLLSNEKLKEISFSAQEFSKRENDKLLKDLEILNERLFTANAEHKQMQRESQNEIKQLQFELAAVNSMISESEIEARNNLNKKIDQLRIQLEEQNEDWKIKLADQKLRYDELKKHWQFENERTQHLTQEVNKLRKKNLKDNVLKKPSSKRLVINNFDRSDEESSRDSPPDFVKDAQTRLQQLDQEARDFDSMLNKYRVKEINASAKLIRNSAFPVNIEKMNNYAEYQPFKKDNGIFANPSIKMAPVLEMYREIKEDIIKVVEEETKDRTIKESNEETTKLKVVAENIPAKITDAKTSDTAVINEPVKVDDDWEIRLKARDEERRKRDEEFLKRQQEEIKEIEKEPTLEPAAPVSEIKKPHAPAVSAIDPVMEKYMQMVSEQKRQQQAQNQKTDQLDEKTVPVNKVEPKDEDIEVASLERPSSSEFEW